MARTHQTLTSLFSDIADSIREKTGDSNQIVADNFPTAIANIPSGGGIVNQGVFFIDYDGELIEAWNTSEVASKTSLPDNPTHNGLTAQGWNWTLNDIKNYILNYPSANVIVGQMYKTTSRLTEIYIELTKATGLSVTCNMVGNKNWGDGTTDNLSSHTYEDYGKYIITCDGTTIPSGTSSTGGMFSSKSSGVNRFWCTSIRIGENVTSIGNYAFQYCYSINYVTIPNNVTSIGTYAFRYDYCLKNIIIPSSITIINNNTFIYCYALTNISLSNNVTSIGNAAFQYCFNIQNITLSSNLTSIGYNAFANCYLLDKIIYSNSLISVKYSAFTSCYSLKSITLNSGLTDIDDYIFQNCYQLINMTFPSNITRIGQNAFTNCYAIIKYDFSNCTSIPTLSNTSAFTEINGNCKIIVPENLYDEWIVAENWSAYANYITKPAE